MPVDTIKTKMQVTPDKDAHVMTFGLVNDCRRSVDICHAKMPVTSTHEHEYLVL